MNYCRDCKHWEAAMGITVSYGICHKIQNRLLFPEALMVASEGASATFNTLPIFGCNMFEAK